MDDRTEADDAGVNGFVIGDDCAALTLNDVFDAIALHADEDMCDSQFHYCGCTRERHHDGPHMASCGPASIVAVWEDKL